MKVIEVLDTYLIQLEADGRSPHTIGQARRHVGLFARFVGDRDIAELGHEDVARFLTSAMAMRTSDGRVKRPGSTNALRSSIRGFFTYAAASGLAPTNAARLVRRARCGPPVPRPLSEQECERLVRALALACTPAEKRDCAIIHAMLGCGLRLGSAVGLDIEDVNFVAGELHLRGMKGQREGIVYVSADLAEVMRSHIGGRTSGPVFLGTTGDRIGSRQVHRRVQLWGTRAGIPGLGPHRLRHSFGTRIYRATGDILLTSRAMSHRSLGSTMRYAQVDEARVRAAVAGRA